MVTTGSHGNLLVVMVTSQTLVNISSASGASVSARGLFGTCRDQLESETLIILSHKPSTTSSNLLLSQTAEHLVNFFTSTALTNKHFTILHFNIRVFHIIS